MMHKFARVLAAGLLLLGATVHLRLWRGGYAGIPYVGSLFLANVIASTAVAAAIIIRPNRAIALAGVAVAVGSLVSLALSRTVGIFGFMEAGWSIDALRTAGAETGSVVALFLVVILERRARHLKLAVATV